MTIGTSNNQNIVYGNGVTSAFDFTFFTNSSSAVSVQYTSGGTTTTLQPTAYNISYNAPAPNQLESQGGVVTYPLTGSPIGNTSYLTITRNQPLLQTTSLANQGNEYPTATELALDALELQIQQTSNRTTQFRGIWITNTYYNEGDIVQDGTNGADSLNYYICSIQNTSGVWATDFANGDWTLSVLAVVPATNLPITLSGAVTGTGTTAITTTLASQPSNTVLSNATAANGVPTAVALTASTLLGRAATGNITAVPFSSLSSFNSITGCLPTSISGSNTTASMTVGSGLATDSTNAVNLTSAGYSWAASNGNAINGTDAGSSTLADSTTYHMFLCSGGSGTGTFASASLTPTFPTGYTTYKRRIFSFNTTSAGAPIPYTAIEAEGGSVLAWFATQLLDISTTSLGTTRILYTLTVPSGIKVQPIGRYSASSSESLIITSGDETDVAESSSGARFSSAPGADFMDNGTGTVGLNSYLTTNTSGQIGARASTTSVDFYWVTRGFKDWRRN